MMKILIKRREREKDGQIDMKTETHKWRHRLKERYRDGERKTEKQKW